jgi:PAS domain-containing protein
LAVTLKEPSPDCPAFDECVLPSPIYHWRPEGISRQVFRAAESAGEAIISARLDGTITYVNPAFERITQYPREVVEIHLEPPGQLLCGGVPPAQTHFVHAAGPLQDSLPRSQRKRRVPRFGSRSIRAMYRESDADE